MDRNFLTRQLHEWPAFLVAAVGSNSGKTSITLGLIHALHRKGVSVQPFKCGPDYLDSTYLSQAALRTCYNLDTWMMGESYIKTLFDTQSSAADISIIEGAMGLFDGASASGEAGTAAPVSRLLNIPVLLVLDIVGILSSTVTIAIAQDDAFQFVYQDDLEELEQAGAKLVSFFPIDTQLQRKRKTLAYSDVSILASCHSGGAGESAKGHRFHYSQIIAERLAMKNWQQVYRVHHPRTEETIDEGYFKNNTLASYVHLHWASSPLAISSFVDCYRSKQ